MDMPGDAGIENNIIWASRETFRGKPSQQEAARWVSRNVMAVKTAGTNAKQRANRRERTGRNLL